MPGLLDICVYLSFYICVGPKRNVSSNNVFLMQMFTESHK